jgi:transposase-like protein
MELEERRAELQGELETLVNRMSALRDSLFEDSGLSAFNGGGISGGGRRGGKAPRMGRGELKNQMVNALTTAGSNGVRVADLARELGIKPVNIHSWFHSAMRRYPEIKKLDRGMYRLDGPFSGTLDTPSPSSSSARAPRAGKPGRSTAPHSKRGELSKRILAELTAAGQKGVNVKDLSAKIGAPYKNIYIWFATTGKKNKGIKKIAPATYRLS